MALSREFIENHITAWQRTLDTQYWPYRTKWPSRLFHHAPIENAVQILRDGNLRSRQDPLNGRQRDVAAAGVIDNRIHAHDFARLYFRPRTPTQWHIEGIRKDNDATYNNAAHAPVLVMLIFDARAVLSRHGVSFCDRNMQLGAAVPSDTEEYFAAIPFQKVFHEGNTGGDRSIIDHRCAEVLAGSPLPLQECLQWIYCRTAAERMTLFHMLGDQGQAWAPRMQISDDLLVFERRYVFVEEVSLDPKGVVVRLNPRRDRQPVDTTVKAWHLDGRVAVDFRNPQMPAVPLPPHTRWLIQAPAPLQSGTYLVEVTLEGHLAFRSHLTLGGNIFL